MAATRMKASFFMASFLPGLAQMLSLSACRPSASARLWMEHSTAYARRALELAVSSGGQSSLHVRFAPKAHVSRSTRSNAWRRVKYAGVPNHYRLAVLIRKWSAERRLCDTRAAHLFSPIFDRESTRAAGDETQVRAGFSHSKRP